jgi:subtilase family serine protease
VHFVLIAVNQRNTDKEMSMTLQGSPRWGAVVLLIALLTVTCLSDAQRTTNNVPAGIQLSRDLGLSDPAKQINITVHLQLPDRAAFDKAVDALYDPASPTYHKWMTNADLAKYGPSEAQRQTVRQELQKHGLTILSTDKIGFVIRAHGTIGNVERAFNTEIHEFEYNGRTYRANVRNAHLSGDAGNYVSSVAGIEAHQVRPMAVRAVNLHTQKPFPSVPMSKLAKGSGFPPVSTTDCLSAPATYNLQGSTSLPTAVYTGTVYSIDNNLICDYLPNQLQIALGLPDVYTAGYNGAGQTIALVEGYGYPTIEKDANAFSKLAGLPPFTAKNYSTVYPEGKPNPKLGALTGWDIEIALDIDSAHSVAPGASILEVITNGQDNEDFQTSILYVAENNLANQMSNSYEEDLDLIAGADEQTSWDDTLEVATAKGITVDFSSGDGGDNGLGTPLGAPLVPAVAPHSTAVGGTSILNDLYHSAGTITTVWGDTVTFLESGDTVLDPPELLGLLGGGGGGESVFWPKPSWQKGVPGKGRGVPDVSALSDPYTGFPIVVTSGGTQFIEFGWGGTSLGCPIFTAFWALANEKAGTPLGQAAPLIASIPGSVQDVLPTTDSSPNNLTGSITDSSGTTTYSASALFDGALYRNKGFTSTIWELDSTDFVDFGFGIDSSLTVKRGWDNATGYGTPYGLAFINAVTGSN